MSATAILGQQSARIASEWPSTPSVPGANGTSTSSASPVLEEIGYWLYTCSLSRRLGKTVVPKYHCNIGERRLVMSARSVVPSHGFEWRILLGPSHDWPVFKAEPNLIKQQLPAVERCELCREPIDSSKPFTTNSAGEQPIHLACQNEDTELASRGHCSSRRMWGRWLWKFFCFESPQQSQLSSKWWHG